MKTFGSIVGALFRLTSLLAPLALVTGCLEDATAEEHVQDSRLTGLEQKIAALELQLQTTQATLDSLDVAHSALAGRVTSAEADLTTLREVELAAVAAELANAENGLNARIVTLEAKTWPLMTADQDGQPALVISGVNVFIQNGTSASAPVANGVGNLIVGYNRDSSAGAQRTGSHNVVIGDNHSYTALNGLVAGGSNRLNGNGAVVFGSNNTVSGSSAAVLGGSQNTASGSQSVVVAGSQNIASASTAVVVSGRSNRSEGTNGTVLSGSQNVITARGDTAVIGSGNKNKNEGVGSAIVGGSCNYIGLAQNQVVDADNGTSTTCAAP